MGRVDGWGLVGVAEMMKRRQSLYQEKILGISSGSSWWIVHLAARKQGFINRGKETMEKRETFGFEGRRIMEI